MMPMQSSGFAPAMMHLHAVFAGLWLIGVVFLLRYGWKHLSAEKLKMWGWWLFGIGAVGAIVTAGAMGDGHWGKGMMHGRMMDPRTMQTMMDTLDSQKGTMSKSQYDGMKKFMEDMMKSESSAGMKAQP